MPPILLVLPQQFAINTRIQGLDLSVHDFEQKLAPVLEGLLQAIEPPPALIDR